MLKLYTKNKMPNTKMVVTIPWKNYFRKYKITREFDDSDTQIIKAIEKTSIINNETIYGKFSDMPIGIGLLSEGCKTLLCINHAIKTGNISKYIFNIASCGGNAVSYLATEMAKETDINAYLNHGSFGSSLYCNIQINDNTTIYKDATLASNEYMDILMEDIDG